jgi:hypothetical protein
MSNLLRMTITHDEGGEGPVHSYLPMLITMNTQYMSGNYRIWGIPVSV